MMSTEHMRSEIERLRAENDALKRQTAHVNAIRLNMWRIVEMGDEIKRFIEENRGRLEVKE